MKLPVLCGRSHIYSTNGGDKVIEHRVIWWLQVHMNNSCWNPGHKQVWLLNCVTTFITVIDCSVPGERLQQPFLAVDLRKLQLSSPMNIWSCELIFFKLIIFIPNTKLHICITARRGESEATRFLVLHSLSSEATISPREHCRHDALPRSNLNIYSPEGGQKGRCPN